MKIIIMGFVIILYVLMNYYIGNNILNLLKFIFKVVNIYVFYIIFGIIVILSIISFRKINGNIGNILGYIGSFYMGLSIYLFLFFGCKDIIRLIFGNINNLNVIGSSLVLIVSFGVCIYGVFNASKIKSISYNVKDNEIKSSYNVVLVADLHLGAIGSESNLKKVISKINETNPDLVCIVGDLFNDEFKTINKPNELSKLFKSIKTKYGVYMSLGNHDGGDSFDQMIKFVKDSNIKLLNDEYTIINNDFVLLGRVDGTPIGGFNGLKRKDTKKVLSQIRNMPIIVMDHNPANIKEYDNSINLLLSGHTHKGQIFPANLVTRNMYVVDYGMFEKNSQYPLTIVTSGAGTWGMPMRIGSHSEVVLIKVNK